MCEYNTPFPISFPIGSCWCNEETEWWNRGLLEHHHYFEATPLPLEYLELEDIEDEKESYERYLYGDDIESESESESENEY